MVNAVRAAGSAATQREPLVSVILPVYNAERFVRQALASVQAQTYPNFEIIVVDGGSTDGTLPLVRGAAHTRIFQQPGQGLADAWNAGLAASRGEYISFIDSDDTWPPAKLRQQVDYLEQLPEVEYIVGYVTFSLEPECPRPALLRPEVFTGAHVGYMPGTLMARRALFDRLGGFETEWTITPDIDWVARMQAEDVRRAVLPEVWLTKRVHEANLTTVTGPEVMQRELLRLLRQALDRRRAREQGIENGR